MSRRRFDRWDPSVRPRLIQGECDDTDRRKDLGFRLLDVVSHDLSFRGSSSI